MFLEPVRPGPAETIEFGDGSIKVVRVEVHEHLHQRERRIESDEADALGHHPVAVVEIVSNQREAIAPHGKNAAHLPLRLSGTRLPSGQDKRENVLSVDVSHETKGSAILVDEVVRQPCLYVGGRARVEEGAPGLENIRS